MYKALKQPLGHVCIRLDGQLQQVLYNHTQNLRGHCMNDKKCVCFLTGLVCFHSKLQLLPYPGHALLHHTTCMLADVRWASLQVVILALGKLCMPYTCCLSL